MFLSLHKNPVELSLELKKLHEQFQKWQDGSINAFDLNDEIHKFHNGAARSLYVTHVMGDAMTSVLVAIANGTVQKEELPEGLLAELEPALTAWKVEFQTDQN